ASPAPSAAYAHTPDGSHRRRSCPWEYRRHNAWPASVRPHRGSARYGLPSWQLPQSGAHESPPPEWSVVESSASLHPQASEFSQEDCSSKTHSARPLTEAVPARIEYRNVSSSALR